MGRNGPERLVPPYNTKEEKEPHGSKTREVSQITVTSPEASSVVTQVITGAGMICASKPFGNSNWLRRKHIKTVNCMLSTFIRLSYNDLKHIFSIQILIS